MRLGQTIAGFQDILGPEIIDVTILVDVPRVQYYLYMLEAHSRNLISQDLLLKWFDLVDQRHAMITRRLMALLSPALPDRSLSRSPDIRRANSFDILGDAIRESVSSGRAVLVKHLANVLERNDVTWQLILEAVKPGNYRDLIHLSYVREQIYAGRQPAKGRPLGVVIENHNERQTHKLSNQVAAAIMTKHVGFRWLSLGLFPKEDIYVTGDSDLYLRDPAKVFVDQTTGEQYSISALLDEVYRGTGFASDAAASKRTLMDG